MKKVFIVAASLFLVVVAVNAQKEKKEPPPPPASQGINSQKDFLKRNPAIATVNWQSGKQKMIILKFKSGAEERYDLTNKTEQETFASKYGAAPKQPPPPPAKVEMTKFTPPKIVKDEEVKVQPVIAVKGEKADGFYKRNPGVSDISRQGNIITLKMKDGTTEKYDMSKKEEDKSFTEKYGVCPIPPPPPPPKMKSKA